MREMLVAAAVRSTRVPPNEQMVLGVTLFYCSWEDSAGLPAQIVMQAPRKALLDFQTNRRDRADAGRRHPGPGVLNMRSARC